MSTISIQKTGITRLDTDAIVNAANEGLWAGAGVCGAIFQDAGHDELQAACSRIGHCDTGSAVITPGFKLKAKYIIHAVGPVWNGGNRNEPQQLYGAYYRSLELAAENGCRSVGFPLISAGIFGYPKDKAWKKAIQACRDFFDQHPQADIRVVFAILADDILEQGRKILQEEAPQYEEHAGRSGEKEAIEQFRKMNYPKPSLTADIAVFARQEGTLRLLMIRRGGHPFRGCWALPGGFADEGETIEQTAARELEEETGIKGLSLSLVGIYSAPGRDPRGWTVSAAYTVLLSDGMIQAVAGDDAAETRWIEVQIHDGEAQVLLPDSSGFAFDHEQIIADSVRCLMKKQERNSEEK